MRTRLSTTIVLPLIIALAGIGPRPAIAEDATQKTYATPADAMRALVAAARVDNTTELHSILGPGSDDVISSGDDIADRAARKRFATWAAEHQQLETLPSGAVIAHVGKEDWPL